MVNVVSDPDKALLLAMTQDGSCTFVPGNKDKESLVEVSLFIVGNIF